MSNIQNAISIESSIILDVSNRINAIISAVPQLEKDIEMIVKDNQTILDYCKDTTSMDYTLAKENLDKILELQKLFSTIRIEKEVERNVL